MFVSEEREEEEEKSVNTSMCIRVEETNQKAESKQPETVQFVKEEVEDDS